MRTRWPIARTRDACGASLAARAQGRSNEVPFLAEFSVAGGAGGVCVMTAVFKCVDEGAAEAAIKVRGMTESRVCFRLARLLPRVRVSPCAAVTLGRRDWC